MKNNTIKNHIDLDLTHRPDISYIAKLIQTGERVLDLGCGYGELMWLLKRQGVRVQGIEKDDRCIIQCVKTRTVCAPWRY
jgi:2-polyprenyl-3-methyl-5-hydroxy-6-metoxy-1,4-benzoquinol methylase